MPNVIQDNHPQPSDAVLQLHTDLSAHLDRILEHFKPGAKVTLVVRRPDASYDAGVVIGNDDLEGAVAEIRRRQATEIRARAEASGNAPTAIQDATLTYMRVFIAERGMPPTLRELADFFQLSSLNAISQRMREMEKKGLVIHTPNAARGWRPA